MHDSEPLALAVALGKAPIGTACNACGLCCMVQPCMIAVEFLGAEDGGRCPALESVGEGRYECGMTTHPGRYLDLPAYADKALAPYFAHALGVGLGCDSFVPGYDPLQGVLARVRLHREMMDRHGIAG